MSKSKPRTFSRLVLWEIEGCLNLFIFALITASAIIAVLVQTSSSRALANSYINLYDGASTVFLILTLVASTLFSHSFAGALGKGELKRTLSYPVKRWQVFLAKVIAINLIIFGVYASVFTLHLYLSSLSVFEPLFYVSLFVMLLQLFLACAVSVTISLITNNEIMSILISFLLILGIDHTLGVNSYFSSQGRFRYIFGYFEQTVHNNNLAINVPVTFEQAALAITIPIITAAVMLTTSFVYFVHKMEVD
ncbi:MAG: hypothetical protein ACPLIG_03925 [Candidatus Bathyarchaeales archaeon]